MNLIISVPFITVSVPTIKDIYSQTRKVKKSCSDQRKNYIDIYKPLQKKCSDKRKIKNKLDKKAVFEYLLR